MGEFGNTFRKEREKKGISFEDASNVTKISSRMLRAIEEERFDELPGGIFNKGFIRAYAKCLGLNDDEAVAGYLACLREAQLDAREVWDAQARSGAPAKRSNGAAKREAMKPPSSEGEELPELQLPRAEHVSRPKRDYPEQREGIPWKILALAILVIILAAVLWHRHLLGARSEATSTAPPPASAPEPAPPPATTTAVITTPAPAPSRPPAIALGSAPTTAAAKAMLTGGAQPPVRPPAATPVRAAPAVASDAGAQSAEVVNPGLSTAPPAPLALVIRASENSWISVTADGEPVLHELLIAPAHTSVRASREIVLKVGNAAGVNFLWNGSELPAQGTEGEVKTLVFDANGMRVLSTAPAQNP